MRRIACQLLIVVAALALPATALAQRAATADRSTVSVTRCHTQFGITGRHRSPRTVTVRGTPVALKGLVAYTNTQGFLVAPKGMACSGIVGADGGSQLLVWRRGQHSPRTHSHDAGLSLAVEPACAGCRADEACPFFTALARKLGFPCQTGIPADETVTRPDPNTALFEDPPGVAGDGLPSGGPFPANGIVGITGPEQEVYRATCTLPAARTGVCTTSLNDVAARFGSGHGSRGIARAAGAQPTMPTGNVAGVQRRPLRRVPGEPCAGSGRRSGSAGRTPPACSRGWP